MLKNENIICISSIDWDFIWQGHQEIMSTFAKNGNKVLFIENTGVRVPGIRDISRIRNRIKNWLKGIKGIRQEMENLYVFSPLVLPFPYSKIARWFNRRLVLTILEKWMKIMDFSDPIIWTFLPTPLSIEISENLVMKKLLIYYCIDNFSVSSASAKKVRRSEDNLLKKADLVFVTSNALYERCTKYNNNVYNFPFAVNFEDFEKVRLGDNKAPQELRDIKRPIIGYVGGIHKWVDQGIIKRLAEENPNYSFVFVGPVQTSINLLSNLKNVYFLGKKDHSLVALYIKNFDVGTIPYLITDYTRNVYPTKLNEYLSLGKPVISTSIPEIEKFNEKHKEVSYVASDVASFRDCITKALNEKGEHLVNRRIDIAEKNSWSNRLKEMCALIGKEINKKKLDREAKWKERLVGFYKVARKRFLRIATLSIFIYLLLFKTAFLWFLAKPLKISDAPQKADAIVVFGGGVGESGSPGKSTIERARYAVMLYEKGFADKVVFSSGYTYTYNDAENMKLFAISMGMPGRDIILEQKANSTYENVIYSKRILDEKGFDSILLISSPYNMRRAWFVFNKWAKGIKVFYAPVEKCQFYDKSMGVRMGQIRGIMHEYMGIAYYLFKGYI